MTVIKVYKPIGKTPLDMIHELKTKPRYTSTKMSYAGRLDPMAEGLLIILTDDDCLKQQLYHNLNKVYDFQLLLGISTDTYDILGMITDNKPIINYSIQSIYNCIYSFGTTFKQYYPPFSSQRVAGKPLWYYARNNSLSDIDIPYKMITIHSINIKKHHVKSHTSILKYINDSINLLDSQKNFRQNDILKGWSKLSEGNYLIVDVRTHVSSGTYIRSLCHSIGKKLNIPCMAYSIKRQTVGDYKV